MLRDQLCGIDQEIQAAFLRFFKGRIDETLERQADGQALDKIERPYYSARIELKSEDTAGILAVRTDKRLLFQSHPDRKYGDELEEEDLVDWAGELVNRVLGDLKNWLLDHGVSTRLSPPEAQEGDWTLDAMGEEFESFELDFVAADMGIQVRMLLRRGIGNQVRNESAKISAS